MVVVSDWLATFDGYPTRARALSTKRRQSCQYGVWEWHKRVIAPRGYTTNEFSAHDSKCVPFHGPEWAHACDLIVIKSVPTSPTYVIQLFTIILQWTASSHKTTDHAFTNHWCTLLCSKHLSNKCTRKIGWKRSRINFRPLTCWIRGSPSNWWLVKWGSADPLVLRQAW